MFAIEIPVVKAKVVRCDNNGIKGMEEKLTTSNIKTINDNSKKY
ncbi:MAG: hypothetical protein ABI419_01285 [Ginsengibacter sp.]